MKVVKSFIALTGVAAFGIVGVGVGAAVFADESEQVRSVQPGEQAVPRPSVASPEPGKTMEFGEWKVGETPPDLVGGQTDDGRDGYLRTYDLVNMPEPDGEGRIIINVYEEDGKTIIGSFTAATVTEELENGAE